MSTKVTDDLSLFWNPSSMTFVSADTWSVQLRAMVWGITAFMVGPMRFNRAFQKFESHWHWHALRQKAYLELTGLEPWLDWKDLGSLPVERAFCCTQLSQRGVLEVQTNNFVCPFHLSSLMSLYLYAESGLWFSFLSDKKFAIFTEDGTTIRAHLFKDSLIFTNSPAHSLTLALLSPLHSLIS